MSNVTAVSDGKNPNPETLFVDRTGWPAGPWDDELDRYEWKDDATGLDCLIVRAHGNLCGYVAVPAGHHYHGKDYEEPDVDVHGGLTYAGACKGRVCHVPAPGEPDNVWWFGFDCAHYADLIPRDSRVYSMDFNMGEYRDVAYVKAQVLGLAKQLR